MWEFWWTKWRWGMLSLSTSVSPAANFHSTDCFTHIISHQGVGTICQTVANVPCGLILIPPKETTTKKNYSIPNQEALTMAEALVTNFFCCFGVPRELHNDQGRNFESRLIQEVLQHLGVSKTPITPLHPQSDGMVEH
jgi:hypothetical protein